MALVMINRFVHDPSYIRNAKSKPFDGLGLGALVVWTGALQVVLDKGQEDDWFGAVRGFAGRWGRWWPRLSIGYGGHGSQKDTLVDLKVLKNATSGWAVC